MKMNCEKLIETYNQELETIIKRKQNFIKQAINYNELVSSTNDESVINNDELIWNDARDAREYELINLSESILIEIVDRLTSAIIDNDKERHRNKKNIEMAKTSLRKIKKESLTAIEKENEVITLADKVLNVLAEIY